MFIKKAFFTLFVEFPLFKKKIFWHYVNDLLFFFIEETFLQMEPA